MTMEKSSFNDECLNRVQYWYKSFYKKDYVECDRISEEQIKISREVLQNRTFGDSSTEYDTAFVMGVLFKGFIEFTQLALLTRDTEWPKDQQRTESIWQLMCNCIDRFDFCRKILLSSDFNMQLESLEGLRQNFLQNFGNGIYASPEIYIKKEICSICEQDTRACLHLPGNLYNGKMCYSVPQDMEMKTVSLVTIPRDPRCRMWHWNLKEDNTITGAILTLFRIDDWNE